MNDPMTPISGTSCPDRRFTLSRVGIVVATLMVVLVIFSVTIVQTGQVGVLVRSGSDDVRVIAEPGVYGRLPFLERVWLVDTRLQTSQQRTAQSYVTADKKTMQIAAWLAWRITDPVRFTTATSVGKNPIEERVLKALSETLAVVVSASPASALLRGHDGKRWLVDINQRLELLGIQAEDIGLSQVGLSEEATEAIYAEMSAIRIRTSQQLIEGLAADERQLIALQLRQRDLVLEDAYRVALTARQTAESRVLAAYARQYGSSGGFADVLRNPPQVTDAAATANVTASPQTNSGQ